MSDKRPSPSSVVPRAGCDLASRYCDAHHSWMVNAERLNVAGVIVDAEAPSVGGS